ncbi:MAG: outer membrane beta-barrel protein [Paracoccus aminovorans]|nr:outer membrane beta-barrel protein [Paracoccus aminovorans]
MILSAVAALTGTAALAGGYQSPVVETAPVAVVETAPAEVDWTGFYAGLQGGQGNADVSFGSASADLGDFDAWGLHGGYQRDMGQYVLGGELDYNRLTGDGDGHADLWRLRGRVGADLGKFQPYVTLGVARYSDDELSETGFSYGIGAEYLLTPRFSMGAEYSRNSFSDVADRDGLDLDADAVQLRGSFRF